MGWAGRDQDMGLGPIDTLYPNPTPELACIYLVLSCGTSEARPKQVDLLGLLQLYPEKGKHIPLALQ